MSDKPLDGWVPRINRIKTALPDKVDRGDMGLV